MPYICFCFSAPKTYSLNNTAQIDTGGNVDKSILKVCNNNLLTFIVATVNWLDFNMLINVFVSHLKYQNKNHPFMYRLTFRLTWRRKSSSSSMISERKMGTKGPSRVDSQAKSCW